MHRDYKQELDKGLLVTITLDEYRDLLEDKFTLKLREEQLAELIQVSNDLRQEITLIREKYTYISTLEELEAEKEAYNEQRL